MNAQSLRSDPILCAHLLRRVDEKLVELLSRLEPSEWVLETLAPAYRRNGCWLSWASIS